MRSARSSPNVLVIIGLSIFVLAIGARGHTRQYPKTEIPMNPSSTLSAVKGSPTQPPFPIAQDFPTEPRCLISPRRTKTPPLTAAINARSPSLITGSSLSPPYASDRYHGHLGRDKESPVVQESGNEQFSGTKYGLGVPLTVCPRGRPSLPPSAPHLSSSSSSSTATNNSGPQSSPTKLPGLWASSSRPHLQQLSMARHIKTDLRLAPRLPARADLADTSSGRPRARAPPAAGRAHDPANTHDAIGIILYVLLFAYLLGTFYWMVDERNVLLVRVFD